MKIIKKLKNWNPSLYATILILLLPFCIFIFQKFKLDNDFWFLINTGKIILEKGFITIEPFTIHEGLSFLPQQWLTDIIFYLIYNKFNIEGMFIFELLINSLIIIFIYKSCILISKKRNISIFITFIIDSLLISNEILTTRPQMFDIVLFTLELYLLELYINKHQVKYLIFIPFISLLMINLHASMWFMLFVLLIPYYIEYIIKKRKKKDCFNLLPIIISTFISILFGLINPYHVNSILYLFNSYGIKEINLVVGEMSPLNITKHTLIYIFIFMILITIYKNKGKNKIRFILLFLGTSFLTLNHYKGFLVCLICSSFLLSDAFKDKNQLKKINLNLFEKVVYCVLIVGLVILISSNVKFLKNPKIKIIADYLDNNATKNIKLFTGYDNGSYFEYRGYKCYIDPRAEVFLKNNNKKEDIFKEYYYMNVGKINVKDFLEKYKFDYLVVNDKELLLLMELKRNYDYKFILDVSDSNGKNYLYRRISEKNS